MSLFNCLLTHQKQDLLVVGYTRHIDIDKIDKKQQLQHYPHHPIPSELINLLLQFLDCSVQWNIYGDELIQFLSAKNGEAIAGPSFTMKDIKFNLYLTPNGINESEQGYVQFLAAPIFMSSNINSIALWYSFYCKQTNSEWNNTTVFYSDDHDCASWPVHTLHRSQITSQFMLKPKYNQHINYKNNSKTNKNPKTNNNSKTDNKLHCDYIVSEKHKLQFLCYIDILNIEYKNELEPYYGANNIYMNKYAKFQWNIYDQTLHDFRYCVYGKYFFKNINANWMLECAPNGQSIEDEGNVNVLLSLLRLPHKIKSVLVHMILNCDYHDIQWDFKLKFDLENNSYGWPDFTMLSSYLLTITSITFTVEMTILKVYDKNDIEIADDKWTEYGIIDNIKELDKGFDLNFKQRHKAKLQSQQKMVHVEQSTMRTLGTKNKRDIKDLKNVQMLKGNFRNRFRRYSGLQLDGTELLVELILAASHGLQL